MVTKQAVVDAFRYVYEAFLSDDFSKTSSFLGKGEQDLLIPIRLYLLGYFAKEGAICVEPEVEIKISANEWGRIDFVIDNNVAVEFAVQPSWSKVKNNLIASQNEKELKKLTRYSNISLLVLFDFSESRENSKGRIDQIIDSYRKYEFSLGKGNFERYPFNIAYFYRDENNNVKVEEANIRGIARN